MPSTSAKQHNFMAAVAHNPAFAKKAGVPQSVGKDFNQADKGRKFSKGGDMKMVSKGSMAKSGMHKMPDGKMMKNSAMKNGGMAKADMKQDKGMMQKAVNKHEGRLHKGATMTKLNMGGMAYAKGGFTKAADGVAKKGKTQAMQVKMSKGGRAC